MAHEAHDPEAGTSMSRRVMLRSVGAAVGAAVLVPRLAGAQTPPSGPVAPPSTVTSPRLGQPPELGGYKLSGSRMRPMRSVNQ